MILYLSNDNKDLINYIKRYFDVFNLDKYFSLNDNDIDNIIMDFMLHPDSGYFINDAHRIESTVFSYYINIYVNKRLLDQEINEYVKNLMKLNDRTYREYYLYFSYIIDIYQVFIDTSIVRQEFCPVYCLPIKQYPPKLHKTKEEIERSVNNIKATIIDAEYLFLYIFIMKLYIKNKKEYHLEGIQLREPRYSNFNKL